MYLNTKRPAPLCDRQEQSVFYYVTADNKEDWPNGIFHNGMYGIFQFMTESKKLELISCASSKSPKFRKCNCASETIAEQKIAAWLDKYNDLAPVVAPTAA